MNDPKPFLSRWSRLKLESGAEATALSPSAAISPEPAAGASSEAAVAGEEFDIASLPPIDSIEAASDVRAFLQRGVPASLTRAALRRAWSADPAIRDFIGLSENSWDFNAPDSVRGFGPLAPEEVKRLAAQFFAAPEQTAAAADSEPLVGGGRSAAQPEACTDEFADRQMAQTQTGAIVPSSMPPENPRETATSVPSAGGEPVDAAAQYAASSSNNASPAGVRRHGSALPK